MRIEGRWSESSELTDDIKHPLVLPSKCAFTRLVVLKHHIDSVHVGVHHTILSNRKKFCVVNGHVSEKHYLNQCGRCSLEKAKPVIQLMADLLADRISVSHKPFAVCGLDYFDHINMLKVEAQKKPRASCLREWDLGLYM